MNQRQPQIEPVLLRPRDAGAALGVSAKTIYRLIAAGEVEAVRLGADMKVVPESLVAYRERLRAGSRKAAPRLRTVRATPPRADVIPLRS